MIVCCLKKLNDNGNCAISMAKSEYFTCHVGPLCLHGPPFLTPAKIICNFFSGKLFFLFSPTCKAYLTSIPSINGRKWIKPYLIQYFSFLLVPKKIYRKRRHCFTFTRYANGEILASFWVRVCQGVKGLSKSILVHQGKRQIHAHVSNLRFHLTNLTPNLKRIATEKVLLGWLIQKNI